MQKSSLAILLFLNFVFSTNAQDKVENLDQSNPQKSLIEKSIKIYFDGWLTGDTLKVGKVMHKSCNLKILKDNQVNVIDRKDYLSRFKLRPKLENTSSRIVSIDITGSIAAVKCQIETPKLLFTDYFNMMKLNDEWYIIDKIAASVDKTKISN